MHNLPLLFIDTETTGTDTDTARIVEFGGLGFPAGLDGGHSKYLEIVNPGVMIPEDATKVHGLGDADVRDKRSWRDCGAEINQLMVEYQQRGGLVVCYNGLGYDFPLIATENVRNRVRSSVTTDTQFSGGRVLDVFVFFKWWFRFQRSCSLSSAVESCMVTPGPEHTALGDCVSTLRVLSHGLAHGWIPKDPELALTQQAALLRLYIAETRAYGHYLGVDKMDRIRATTGKSRGAWVEKLQGEEYLDWLLRSDDKSRRGESKYPPMHESMRARLQRIQARTFPINADDRRLHDDVRFALHDVTAIIPDVYEP